MRVWFDALTPKQLLLFNAMAKAFEKRGFETLLTTRDFRETTELMKIRKIDAKIVGKYGGKELKDKLLASIERMKELTHIISQWNPDISISFSSPEASRVAFGLGIPHYIVNDSPHAYFPLKLAIPLAKLLFSIWVIPKKAWTVYGISKKNIINYRSLDPMAWLIDFKPIDWSLEEAGIDLSKKIISIRETEAFASYVLGHVKSITPTVDTLLPLLLENLRDDDIQFVILPRYEAQIKYLEEKYGAEERVVVLKKVVDGATLVYRSKVLIGGGGTMSIEGALMGKAVISTFPRHVYYLEYLRKKGLVFMFKKSDELIYFVKRYLKDQSLREKIKKKSEKFRKTLIDPAEFVADKLTSLFSK